MEWCRKYCLLAIVTLCFGSMCVLAVDDSRLVQAYNDGVYNGDFDDKDEETGAIQELIGEIIGDVNAEEELRDALLEDNPDLLAYAGAKRSGRCRGASSKCIMRGGPNPNTASRVLPFGKRGDSPNTLARRGRGSPKNSRTRGSRPLLPFGKRR